MKDEKKVFHQTPTGHPTVRSEGGAIKVSVGEVQAQEKRDWKTGEKKMGGENANATRDLFPLARKAAGWGIKKPAILDPGLGDCAPQQTDLVFHPCSVFLGVKSCTYQGQYRGLNASPNGRVQGRKVGPGNVHQGYEGGPRNKASGRARNRFQVNRAKLG